ncbi:hypothetical protein [Streptomyces sp. H27-D2]|uniref:hypothetical protein n=1 Tax=Streptomyces sp. H27-D2 TaxID=3046304 RepID=UPI002DB8A97A|nr:hypothetical protein [Streptomyces sp. H27-D2]MEC4016475.1 hypothetical protein [Streptomyces sp. H27-D2]
MPSTRSHQRRFALIAVLLALLAALFCTTTPATANTETVPPGSTATQTTGTQPTSDRLTPTQPTSDRLTSAQPTSDRLTPDDHPAFQHNANAQDDDTPGCRKGDLKNQGEDPATPPRTGSAYDHSPAPAVRAVPDSWTALGAAHSRPAPRGPAPTAPTPVELSVLRV